MPLLSEYDVKQLEFTPTGHVKDIDSQIELRIKRSRQRIRFQNDIPYRPDTDVMTSKQELANVLSAEKKRFHSLRSGLA